MAGGHGKRLRPLTCTMPKPMVPLLNKPVIDYCVELLTAHGITDIAATLHYLPDMIREHLGDGRAFGAEIRYSVEDKPLGTAGSVAAVARPGKPVLVMSGDAITDVDLGALIRAHADSGAAATIVLKRVQVPTEYGVALMDETGRISRFLEKPQLSQVFSDLANTGIYLLSPEAVEMIPKDQAYDFSMDLFPKMLAANMPIMGHVTESYWCDIGDLRAYVQAQRDMLAGKCAFETLAVERDGIFMEHDAKVSPEAVLIAPCYIGRDAEVAGGALLADGTVLCSGVRIGAGEQHQAEHLAASARTGAWEIRGAVIAEAPRWTTMPVSLPAPPWAQEAMWEKGFHNRRGLPVAQQTGGGWGDLPGGCDLGWGPAQEQPGYGGKRLYGWGPWTGASCTDRGCLCKKSERRSKGIGHRHGWEPAGGYAQARGHGGDGVPGRGRI